MVVGVNTKMQTPSRSVSCSLQSQALLPQCPLMPVQTCPFVSAKTCSKEVVIRSLWNQVDMAQISSAGLLFHFGDRNS